MEFTTHLPWPKLVNRIEFILNKSKNQRVLHLGAVDRLDPSKFPIAYLHREITKVAESVVGVDLDKEGIELAKEDGIHNVIYGNVEEMDNIPLNEKFTLILATEIIEHLSNQGKFLEGIKRFFTPNTEMIITTPNSFSFQRFIPTLFLRKEIVHPEHTCYYSYNTLKNLLERHGYIIKEFYGYTLGRPFEMIYRIIPHYSTGLIFVVSLK